MLSLDFKEIQNCNMCYASADHFEVMGVRLNQSQGFKPSRKKGVAVTICRCNACGLVFADPQPLPKHFSDQYNVSAEEYWQGLDVEYADSVFQKELQILSGMGFETGGKKALDIGAGLGKCMIALSNAGMDAYGFEPAKAFYEIAVSHHKISTEKLTLNTLEDADYPNSYFDFITFGAVLEHLHDPDASLKKALSWLKPGGYIHIEVPSAKWLISKLYNFYYKWIRMTNFVTNTSPMHAPFHHFEFTKDSFRKNAGFNNYSIAYCNVEVCETTLPVKHFDPFLKRYMKASGTGLQLIIFLKKNA
jgi:ubiquinone/menaquinone biosynthesis C-methylase UbiE